MTLIWYRLIFATGTALMIWSDTDWTTLLVQSLMTLMWHKLPYTTGTIPNDLDVTQTALHIWYNP